MIVSQLIDSGSKILRSKKIQTHKLDAEIVLSNLLKKQRENLIINDDEKV